MAVRQERAGAPDHGQPAREDARLVRAQRLRPARRRPDAGMARHAGGHELEDPEFFRAPGRRGPAQGDSLPADPV